jgi:MFS family permease
MYYRYITEISPPRSRGTLASIPQLLTTIGICAGYFTCYGSVNIQSSSSWRLPFALQAAIAFMFTVSTLWFLPQSPRWLTARGMHKEALALWEGLDVEAAEREKIEEIDSSKVSEGVEVKDILAVFGKDAWRQTALGAFMMGMQQLSGIDGILYVFSFFSSKLNKTDNDQYAPLLFQSAGLKSSTASFASGISALLMFLVTIPAFLLADRWGRKISTIVGGILQAGCMLIMGSIYAAGKGSGPARWVVVVMIYMFAVIFSTTWAVGFRVYVSEIQPPKTRAAAASLSLSANWVSSDI